MREQFLEEMDAVMPWAELFALVAPHYAKGEVGASRWGLEIMLRRFAGIDLGQAPAPDETMIRTHSGNYMVDDLGPAG